MASDHDVEARNGGIEVELLETVHDQDSSRRRIDDRPRRQLFRPCFPVRVAANRNQRSDAAQFIEYFRLADIAGMKDEIRPFERGRRLGAQQTVRIGDQADQAGRQTRTSAASSARKRGSERTGANKGSTRKKAAIEDRSSSAFESEVNAACQSPREAWIRTIAAMST